MTAIWFWLSCSATDRLRSLSVMPPLSSARRCCLRGTAWVSCHFLIWSLDGSG